MATNMSENGLETLIVSCLRDKQGYIERSSSDYDRENCVDRGVLEAFLHATQQDKIDECFCFATESETRKFYVRLANELQKKGVTDILRKGFRYNNVVFDMYYPTPTEISDFGKKLYTENRFSVIRQLHFSQKTADKSLDVVVFINGLPVATFELKNHFTGQTIKNAIKQYQIDRDPKEPLFRSKRCAVHFAVDDEEVWMCTELKGNDSRFLPFNKGNNGGAGNPVNPDGMRSAYLWEEILGKATLSTIIENYAQVVKKGEKEQVLWPRYHQLDCVRKLLADTKGNEIGRRYLVMHSAGSGKSNTITWLAYQLVSLFKNGVPLLDSVIVVTDSINLDRQIKANITSFKKLQNIIAWAETSSDLASHLAAGKKIIITILHKFPHIVDAMHGELKDKQFAVIIDEAHSSQSGEMAAMMSRTLSNNGIDEDVDDFQTKMDKLMEGRKLPKNANYYAFTATPKNKTLTMFGTKVPQPDGKVESVPFHTYSMKQAIEEGFILDVLKNYTCYNSYYNIIKAVADDPKYDTKEAQKKLHAFVERQPKTIEKKCQIIVDHFCTKTCNKIGGKARAMVVTKSIMTAIEYFHMLNKLLKERGSNFKVIVAFTGEKEYEGKPCTETSLNGFPSSQIPEKMKEEPYRLLVVANKYQTGYDEPLLHTMYVDKQLSDVKAVQTLSRLNRCCDKKTDTFVLDFYNEDEDIKTAFQPYYKGIKLEDEPDINRLNEILDDLDSFNFYTDEDVETFNQKYWNGAPRAEIDALLQAVKARFVSELEEQDMIKAKSKVKAYCRAYPFLAAVLPFASENWEKTYHFLYFLKDILPKLSIEDDDDLIENVDFDKYRIVKQEEKDLQLEDLEASVKPVGVSDGVPREGQKDKLSTILDEFNKKFGGIDWTNKDLINKQVEELPKRLLAIEAFVNAAKNNDKQTAMIQSGSELMTIMALMMQENTELPSKYFDDPDFRNFVNKYVFETAYRQIKKDAHTLKAYDISESDDAVPMAAEP